MPRYGELVTATKLFVTTLWLSKLRCAKLWVNMCKMHTIIYPNEAMHLVSKCQPPQEGSLASRLYIMCWTGRKLGTVLYQRPYGSMTEPCYHPSTPHTLTLLRTLFEISFQEIEWLEAVLKHLLHHRRQIYVHSFIPRLFQYNNPDKRIQIHLKYYLKNLNVLFVFQLISLVSIEWRESRG